MSQFERREARDIQFILSGSFVAILKTRWFIVVVDGISKLACGQRTHAHTHTHP